MLGRKRQERRATGGWPEPWERPGAALEQEDRGASDPEDVWGGAGEAQGPTGRSNQGDGSVHAHHGLALHPDPSFAENKASPGGGVSQAAPRA